MEILKLAINHDDLLAVGIPQGAILDDILGILYDLVFAQEIENTKGVLLERAKEIVRMAI